MEHRRRVRYRGTHPRRFVEKYKEHRAQEHPGVLAKVLAAGKTPAGMHRPIMVEDVLRVLAPQPGDVCVDCTLGYGGHAVAVLERLQPGGRLLGLDADPIELPKTEARLRAGGYGPDQFTAMRSNFAGLTRMLAAAGLERADVILADLGVSSMQLDDPGRGFSLKEQGPLDMRMNPRRAQPASVWLQGTDEQKLAAVLKEYSDEPNAAILARALAGREFSTTRALAEAIRAALPRLGREEKERAVRRVFQALRIAVNDEFSALDMLLRQLPTCLKPGGRAAILSFHSGEDRRVKKALEAGARDGSYAAIAREVLRPSFAERHANPRSAAAKLRWARKA